jgi:hypothetical protein
LDEIGRYVGDLSWEMFYHEFELSGWLHWGDKVLEAREHGVSYSQWGHMLNLGIPHLARLGLVNSEAGFSPEVEALSLFALAVNANVGSSQNELRLHAFYNALDAAAGDVNVYGWYEPAVIANARTTSYPPATDSFYNVAFGLDSWDSQSLGYTLERVTKSGIRRFVDGKYGYTDMEPLQLFESIIGINSSVASHWYRQGLASLDTISRAEEIASRYLCMKPGHVAWFARHPELEVSLNGFAALPTLDLVDRSELNPINNPRGRVVRSWRNQVVPADWWRSSELTSLEDGGIGL